MPATPRVTRAGWIAGISLISLKLVAGCVGEIGEPQGAPAGGGAGGSGFGGSVMGIGGNDFTGSAGTGTNTGGTGNNDPTGSGAAGTSAGDSGGGGGGAAGGTGGGGAGGVSGVSGGTGGNGGAGRGGSSGGTTGGRGGGAGTGTAGRGGAGGTGGGAIGGTGGDPFSAPAKCTSGTMWTGGNRGSADMNPGRACIACHSTMNGPSLTIAGTVYPSAHEPDLCNGANGSNGARVVITGADGVTQTLTPGASGNFNSRTRVTTPFKAKVTYMGRERTMMTAQTSGDCNSCHTQTGTNSAPGRILLP
jgi:hypothetical protein